MSDMEFSDATETWQTVSFRDFSNPGSYPYTNTIKARIGRMELVVCVGKQELRVAVHGIRPFLALMAKLHAELEQEQEREQEREHMTETQDAATGGQG